MSAVPQIKECSQLYRSPERAQPIVRVVARPDQARVPERMLRRLWAMLFLWQQKRETRRILRDLTDDELRDIGVSRAEAGKEVAKSFFWD